MAGNSTTLTFAGDADSLRRAAQQSTAALDDVSSATTGAAREMSDAGGSGADLTTKMGHLGSAVSGATDAIDSASAGMQALADIQSMAANKAARQARLTADVEQAEIDLEQATVDLTQANLDLEQSWLDGEQAVVDGKQAIIDQKQAVLDAQVAQEDYNAAVKEHGKNSAEAQQAAIDLEQATADLSQAQLDQKQAAADALQAENDSAQAMTDMTQSTRDGKDAQLDLNDAMREANPSGLQEWANNLQLVTPLLSAVVGVMGLVTAAQWLWNASLWASPVTWIVLAIAALVAIIVYIAVKTTWFQDAWKWAWSGIKEATGAFWDYLSEVVWPGLQAVFNLVVAGAQWVGRVFGDAWGWVRQHAADTWSYLAGLPARLGAMFAGIADFITRPFRAAFNFVADAWNHTIGRLSWSIPSWVPGIGGNNISAPRLQHYHTGGIVSGALGTESLAVLQAGERVTAGRNGEQTTRVEIGSDGSRLGDLLVEVLGAAIARRGGDVQRVLGVTYG